MTDQELRKLKRHELLELMIHQGKSMARLQQQLEAANARVAEAETDRQQMSETYERLRKKLDEKDLRIGELVAELERADQEKAAELDELRESYERLRKKLDEKDAKIRSVRAEAEGETAELREGYERLRKRLDEKDEKIRYLRDQLALGGSADPEARTAAEAMNEAVTRLNHVVELAQQAAQLHLDTIRGMGRDDNT